MEYDVIDEKIINQGDDWVSRVELCRIPEL
jgi:hypothetical protein